MGKLVKVIILTFLISSLGMINLPSATAGFVFAGVVDQSNVPGVSAFGASIIKTLIFNTFQTFTPTVTDISAVDIFLNGGDIDTRLEILIVDDIGGPVISELAFDPGCPCSPAIPVHVDFTGPQAIPLSIGTENFLDVRLATSSSVTLIEWEGSFADAYLPGVADFPGSDPAIHDFFFRTYFLFIDGIGMTMNLQAGCILTGVSATADFGPVSPPSPGIATFNFQNDGSATLAVSADVGDSTTGGLQDASAVTILPQDMTVDASTTFDAVGTVAMLNTGFPALIANLQPLSSTDENNIAREGTITAATTNLQNLPASGALTGVLTLTGGACT